MELDEINRLLNDYHAAIEALTLARIAVAGDAIVSQRKERVAVIRACIATAMLASD